MVKKVDRQKQKVKLVHEVKRFLFYWLFLALFLCAFTIYRNLLLAEYSIDYFHYGYNVFEAMILAKIILLGQYFHLGEYRFQEKPLIFPTVYKAILFSILVVIFTSIESILHGYIHGKDLAVVYHEFLSTSIYEHCARGLVMFFFFIIFFAFIAVEEVVGEGKLFNLFFCGKSTLVK